MGNFFNDMSNPVEQQKQNQTAIEKLLFGFHFGAQLGLPQTQELFKTKKKTKNILGQMRSNDCSMSK